MPMIFFLLLYTGFLMYSTVLDVMFSTKSYGKYSVLNVMLSSQY